MTDAEQMMELFRGSDLAHGRTEMTGKVSAKGKQETRSWLEKRPVTVADWENHLSGKAGIGIMPLNSENKVKWGAIDVDVYQGLVLEDLDRKITELKLPLVLCRSKSGGPHLFLFLSEWVTAREMVEKLDGLAGALGFGTSEIFPKQVAIGTDGRVPDFGSWINMPYFAGIQFLRYGLNGSGEALRTVSEFIQFALTRRLDAAAFRAYEPPAPPAVFPDGPPCLNAIMAGKPREFRNIILSNASVYLKKAHGAAWKPKLDEINRQLPEPLESGELEAIKRSYDKKDYRYQCSKQPLCNFCNASRCKREKYGIGVQDLLPVTRSLSMLETRPPIWYVDIDKPDGSKVRMSLTTEELQNPRLFQRRVMEATQQMPPSLTMEQWEPVVQGLMVHCRPIPVPEELTPTGQLREHISDFLSHRGSEETFDDILRGMAFLAPDKAYFRMKDLMQHLRNQRFDLLAQHEIIGVLRAEMKAEREFKHIKGKGVNLVVIKRPEKSDLHDPKPEPARFQGVG